MSSSFTSSPSSASAELLDRLEAQLYAYKPQLRNSAAVDRQRLRQRLQQQLCEQHGGGLQVRLPVLQVHDLLVDIERNLAKCRRLGILHAGASHRKECARVTKHGEPAVERRVHAHCYEFPARPPQLSEPSSGEDEEEEDEDTRPLSVLAQKQKKPRLSSPVAYSETHGHAQSSISPLRPQHEDDSSETEQQQQQLVSSRKRRSSYKLISSSSKTRCWSEQQMLSNGSTPAREPIKTTLRANRNNGTSEYTYHVQVPSLAKDCRISINLANMVHEKLNCLYEQQCAILSAPSEAATAATNETSLSSAASLPPLTTEADDEALSRLISEVLVEPNAVETWRATNALDNINNNLSSNYDLSQQFFDSSSSVLARSANGDSRRPKKRQRKNNTKSAAIAKSSPKQPKSKKRGRKPNSKNRSKLLLSTDDTGGDVTAKSDIAKYVEHFGNDCSQTQPSLPAAEEGSMTPAASSTMSQQLVTSTTQHLDDRAASAVAGSSSDQQHNQQQITHYLDGDWANGGPCQLVFTQNIPNITLDSNQIQQEDFTTTTAPFDDFVNYFDCTNTNADNNVIARVLDGVNSVPLSFPLSAFSNIVQNPQTHTLPISAAATCTATTRWNNSATVGQPIEWNNHTHQSFIKITNNDNSTAFVTNLTTLQQNVAPPPPAHSCGIVLDLTKKQKPPTTLVNPIRNGAPGDECLPLDLSVKSNNSGVKKSQPQHHLVDAAPESDDNFIRRLIETSDFVIGPTRTYEKKQSSSTAQVVANEASFKAALDMPLLDFMQEESDVQTTSAEGTPHNDNSDTYNNHTKITTDLFGNMSEAVEFPDQSTKTLFEQLLEDHNNNNNNNDDEHFKVNTSNKNIYEPCATSKNELREETQKNAVLDNAVSCENINDFVQFLNEGEEECEQEPNDQTRADPEAESEQAVNSCDETTWDTTIPSSNENSKIENILTDSPLLNDHKAEEGEPEAEQIEGLHNENETTLDTTIPFSNENSKIENILTDSPLLNDHKAEEKEPEAEKIEGLHNENENEILKIADDDQANSILEPVKIVEATVKTKPMVEIISVESIKRIGSTIIEEDDAYIERILKKNTTNSNAKPNENNNNELTTENATNYTNTNIDLNEVYNEQNINISMPKLMRFNTEYDDDGNIFDEMLNLADVNSNEEVTEKVQSQEIFNAELAANDTEQEIADDQFEFCDLTQELLDEDDVALDNSAADNVGVIKSADVAVSNEETITKRRSSLNAETSLQEVELFPNLSLLEMESQLEQLDFDDEFDDDAVSLATSCFDSNDEDADAKTAATDENQQAPSKDRKHEAKRTPVAATTTTTTTTTNNAAETPLAFKKFKIPKLSNACSSRNRSSTPPAPAPPQLLVAPVAAAATTTKEERKKPPPAPEARKPTSEATVKTTTTTSKFVGLEKLTRTVQNICAVPSLPLISAAPPILPLAPHKRAGLFQLSAPPPPPLTLGANISSAASGISGGGDNNKNGDDDDGGDENTRAAFASTRRHADYVKLQRGFYAATGGEGQNRGPGTLEIAKLFGVTCLPFLVDKCFALAACPLSHKLRDADLLKSALESLAKDKADLSVCYRFMYNHRRLFRLYAGVFCKLYAQRNQRSKLLNMVNDCERYAECTQTLRTIFYSLVQCGLNKVNACRQILSRSHDKSRSTLDCLMSIIMEADWTMFCDYIERFTEVPHYNMRINILYEMAPAALRLKDPLLVSVVFKCLLVLQPDDVGLVQCSRELIQLLELMKSGQAC